MPIQKARARFLDKLAEHAPVFEVLFGEPLAAWRSLSDQAKQICEMYGWAGAIGPSPVWKEIEPEVIHRNEGLAEEHKINLELIPLREALIAFATNFQLLYRGEPAQWAMDFVIASLHSAARQAPEKRLPQWSHPMQFSEHYPAVEPGWTSVTDGRDLEDFFTITIQITARQPNESLRAFAARFNETCREAREQYLSNLRAQQWQTRPPYRSFTWIDLLAQWQFGRKAREIDPSVKTKAKRSAFTRGITEVADYLQITPRISKHHPRKISKH